MSKMFEKMMDIPIDFVNEMQDLMSRSKEIYEWSVWFIENQDVVTSFPDGQEKTLRAYYLEKLEPEEYDAIVKDMQNYVNKFRLNSG